MGRAERITKAIKRHDRLLYCEERGEGKLCVFRESSRVESYRLDDESVLHFVRPAPFFIFALTDDWSMNGRPVEWGELPIMNRLRAMDLWNRDLASDIIDQETKHRKSIERERQNTIESFLLDYRRKFAKTFDDVNTSTMTKKDPRSLGDKKVNG